MRAVAVRRPNVAVFPRIEDKVAALAADHRAGREQLPSQSALASVGARERRGVGRNRAVDRGAVTRESVVRVGTDEGEMELAGYRIDHAGQLEGQGGRAQSTHRHLRPTLPNRPLAIERKGDEAAGDGPDNVPITAEITRSERSRSWEQAH